MNDLAQLFPPAMASEDRRVTVPQTHQHHAVPAAVEAVTGFGFPPDLVSATYRQLLSTGIPGSDANGGLTSSPAGHVTAAALMVAVDEGIRRSASVSTTTASRGVGDAESQTTSFAAAAPFGLTNSEPRQSDVIVAAVSPTSVAEMSRGVGIPGDLQQEVADSLRVQQQRSGENTATDLAPRHSVASNAEVAATTTTTSTTQSTANIDPLPGNATVTDVAAAVADTRHASTITSTAAAAAATTVESTLNAAGLSATSDATVLAPAMPNFSQGDTGTAEAMAHGSTVTSWAAPAGQDRATSRSPRPRPTASAPPQHSGSEAEGESPDRRRRGSVARSGGGDTTLDDDDESTRERRRQLERLRVLRAENRRLKARKMCRQCRQRPVDLTLLPCGHFCFCQECGSSFNACPVCRKTILADVRTFVS